VEGSSPAAGARSAAGSGPEGAADSKRMLVRREHALLSLVELNRKLGRSADAHGAAEALLLNLMGQLGTSRAALWLCSGSEDGALVLIRCHGIAPALAGALATSSWPALRPRFEQERRPVLGSEAHEGLGGLQDLGRQARIEVLAPLSVDDELLGLVALGPRPGGRAYEALDLQVVEASLAIAAVAFRNASLHASLLETNRRLRAALEELRELDRPKTEFINNVNHELRTPLTVVLGSLDCLAQARFDSDASRQLLASATRSAMGLLTLVEKLLAFQSSARDGRPPNMVEGDPQSFLEFFYKERQPGVSAGLRELHFASDGTAQRARFDPQKLRQVMDELVDNAVKFTPQGSHVRLRLLSHIEGQCRWVRIDVEDDGPGIPVDRLPKLFKEFVQLDGSMTRQVGGLGLGLAAARTFVEAMGGRLTASSEPGCGATFTLLLPAI
jgi:signal transduction histidine kinase